MRALAIIPALITLLVLALPAKPASRSTLQSREHRQVLTLHRDHGTIRFFRNHPVQARTPIGKRAARFAHARLVWVKRELAETRAALHPKETSVPQIICSVFGSSCSKALSVASCESRLSVYARNGQYLGIFQMGASERARFGGSSLDPWDQVQAAHRYFSISGWGPWSCA